jgi:transcriptional regulator with XRE-family HTH domain
MEARSFGDFFKECRLRKGQTLRVFCQEHGFDIGNISKLERGRLAPPVAEAKLGEYAKALGLEEGTDDWIEYFDLAAQARGQIPRDILNDEELAAKLPLVFRTLRDGKLDKQVLQELIHKIRKA